MEKIKKYIIILVFVVFVASILIVLFNKANTNTKPTTLTLAEKAEELAEEVQEIRSGTLEIKKLLFKAKNKVSMLSRQCKNVKKELKEVYNLANTPKINSCIELQKYEKILETFKIEVPKNQMETSIKKVKIKNQMETSIKKVKIKNQKQTLKEFDKNIPEGSVEINDKKVIEY